MNNNNKIENILSNRLFILSIIFLILFLVLISKLFALQIIHGEEYSRNLKSFTVKTLSVPAERGNIYDAYGNPLATNTNSYTVTFDPSVSLTNDQYNELCYNLIMLFNKNGDEYIDELPISKTEPYTFLFTSESREKTWKRDMSITDDDIDMNATETLEYLNNLFGVDKSAQKFLGSDDALSNDIKRQIISLRSSIYMERFRKYNLVTLAYDISDRTIAEFQEQSSKYPGVATTAQVQRVYPYGMYTSHAIGYTGKVDEDTLKELNKTAKVQYNQNDVVGRTGLESAFESQLRGKDGSQIVEANNTGRIVNVLDTTEPETGNNIYTTIDANLQQKTYDIIEKYLTEVLINKLNSKSNRDKNISTEDFFASFISANNFNATKLYNNTTDTYSKQVDALVRKNHSDDDLSSYPVYTKALLSEYKNGNISEYTLLMLMLEQEIITPDDELRQKIERKVLSPKSAIIQLLQAGEITPQMTNLDPSSATAVVVDLDTGNVISATNYPSYDNNRLVNTFDNNYYYQLIVLDPTLPLNNRAFQEQRAPGSTFKMLTAIANLENGTITPSSTIYDQVTFKKAGLPYTRCWSSSSHGAINVAKALEVSCNYFFLDTVYMSGEPYNKSDDKGLAILQTYLDYFGFNERTGVEIGEAADTYPKDLRITSSPEYKKYMYQAVNPDITATEYNWYLGDSIRTGIGQGLNNYTAASMAKYLATLVNGGDRYQLHFLNEVRTFSGEVVEKFIPNIELTVPMKQENLDVVLQGMWNVAYGSRGTARAIFKDFPIEVGGKTGTAQEGSRSDHSSFSGFAPYDNPEIAVYVLVPYGTTYSMPSPAAQISRDIMAEYFYIDYESQTNIQQPNTFIK